MLANMLHSLFDVYGRKVVTQTITQRVLTAFFVLAMSV